MLHCRVRRDAALLCVVGMMVIGASSPCAAQPRPRSIFSDTASLSRIADILELSDDQRDIIKAIFEQCKEHGLRATSPRVRAYHDALRSVQNDQSAFVSAINQGEVAPGDVPNFAREFKKAYGLLPDAFAAVEELDDWFFGEVQFILTEAQLPLLPRARLYRQRVLYRHATLPEADIDLAELVASMKPMFQADRIDRLHTWELEYGETLVAQLKIGVENWPRWRNVWHEGYQYHLMASAENAQGHQRGVIGPTAQSLIWDEEFALYGERVGRLAAGPYEQLAILNRTHLATVKELLGPDLAPRLESLYYEAAYPAIHPDAGSAEPLYAWVLERDDLSDDQRITVEQMLAAYRWEHNQLSRQMRESTFERVLGGLRQEIRPDVTIGDRWNELNRLGSQRHTLNGRQKQLLVSVLEPEQAARMPDGTWSDPDAPRPWDPMDERRREHKQRERNRRQRTGGI